MPARLVIDHIIAVCNGCGAKRTFWPDTPLVGAQAFIEWTKDPKNLTPCSCGSPTCDLKAHLLDDEAVAKAGIH